MQYYYEYTTIIGLIYIGASNAAIYHISMEHHSLYDQCVRKETPLIARTILEIEEYLVGTRTLFTVPIQPQGTALELSVWNYLRNIPYGKTQSYKDVAICVKNQNYARAVGTACRKNPILLIIPCHRVIGSNGKLTGFVGGLSLKEKLLALERHRYE